jgi:hypothetical protein
MSNVNYISLPTGIIMSLYIPSTNQWVLIIKELPVSPSCCVRDPHIRALVILFSLIVLRVYKYLKITR